MLGSNIEEHMLWIGYYLSYESITIETKSAVI